MPRNIMSQKITVQTGPTKLQIKPESAFNQHAESMPYPLLSTAADTPTITKGIPAQKQFRYNYKGEIEANSEKKIVLLQ